MFALLPGGVSTFLRYIDVFSIEIRGRMEDEGAALVSA